jgi:hypothetical protein
MLKALDGCSAARKLRRDNSHRVFYGQYDKVSALVAASLTLANEVRNVGSKLKQ